MGLGVSVAEYFCQLLLAEEQMNYVGLNQKNSSVITHFH
jgi:hypothetical protein